MSHPHISIPQTRSPRFVHAYIIAVGTIVLLFFIGDLCSSAGVQCLIVALSAVVESLFASPTASVVLGLSIIK